MEPWIRTNMAVPEDNQVVETKIDDGEGVRNVQTLYRSPNGLWFLPDGSMYVYYTPTHWRNAS